ncbi:MAG: hypothetical protein ACOY40_11685 [Bacillota bacterium]
MKIAFHFDADHERFDRDFGVPVLKEIFRLLLQQDTTNLHLKVFTGDIAALDYLRDKKNREELWRGFFMPPRPVWQSLRPDFMDFLYNKKVFVVAFEGMGARLRDIIHEGMLNDDTYLGAQQIHEANPVHWVLYGASLVPSYRITGSNLHLIYSIGSEDERDEGLAVNFRDELPFSNIVFEELSVSHTILDSYSSYEHAARVANLANKLYDHLNLVADQLMLRLTDLAPDLYDNMYATLTEFENVETSGDLARAALACRKMLEALAGKLSPPGDGPGAAPSGYPDRLRARISEHAGGIGKDVLLAQLLDISARIKELGNADFEAYSGDPSMEAGRLLMGLLVFIHDTIALPALKSGQEAGDRRQETV